MEKEIKPCPTCGSAHINILGDEPADAYCACIACGFTGPVGQWPCETAVDAWNAIERKPHTFTAEELFEIFRRDKPEVLEDGAYLGELGNWSGRLWAVVDGRVNFSELAASLNAIVRKP